ncbi:MAG: alpha/beta hydrolase [Prevotella sp.]|nr:alpha/beta hydrolase [Prevotella sp.]
MKRKFFFLLGFLVLLCCLNLCANSKNKNIEVTTHEYASKEKQALRLDVYVDTTAEVQGLRPVFIFSFGGGWEGGKREDGRPVLEHFAQKGYIAVGIDYRLGIRRLKDEGVKLDSTNFASAYGDAVRMGIEDLFDATRYVIDHAKEWQADTSLIVISGSSAGAINSITAEYLVCNDHPLATSRLPEGFNYAAVIPCAGGIWVSNADTLVWRRKPCPIIAYHGTADQLVPYGKVVLQDGAFSAFGPDYYMPAVKAMGVPTLMHRYEGSDHIIAGIYLKEEARNEMTDNLSRLIFGKDLLHIDTTEEYPERKPATKTFRDTLKEMGIGAEPKVNN